MLEVDKLLNVSLSVFRDLRNNSLDIKTFPVDIFTGLKNLKEMWVLLTIRASFAWKLGVALYYLVPRFSTATFDLDSRVRCYFLLMRCSRKYLFFSPPPPPPSSPRVETTEILRWGGGSKSRQFPGAPSKIDELFKANSCPVEEAMSDFPVNNILKQ